MDAAETVADVECLADQLLGTRIGPYRLERRLGSGAMGVVYLGFCDNSNDEVAVKVLRPELTNDPQCVRRFMHEGQVLREIEHPHVARLHQHGVAQRPAGPLHYLVMERLSGATLEQMLQHQGVLDVEQAVQIASAVAEGLEAVHACQLVHRDLKPANIFLDGGATIKLLDFGVAGAFGSRDSVTSTQFGHIVGTPAYMAPEQIMGRAVDPRADVYAVGAVLYTMLTGAPPFAADSFGEMAIQVASTDALSVAQVRGDGRISAELEALVSRCLEKDPSMRFQNAAELRFALEGVARETATEDRLADYLPLRIRPRLWVVPLAGVSVIAAAALYSDTAERVVPSAGVTSRPSGLATGTASAVDSGATQHRHAAKPNWAGDAALDNADAAANVNGAGVDAHRNATVTRTKRRNESPRSYRRRHTRRRRPAKSRGAVARGRGPPDPSTAEELSRRSQPAPAPLKPKPNRTLKPEPEPKLKPEPKLNRVQDLRHGTLSPYD